MNAYLIAFGVLLLLSGRIGALLGRRRILVAGLTAFTAASLLGGVLLRAPAGTDRGAQGPVEGAPEEAEREEIGAAKARAESAAGVSGSASPGNHRESGPRDRRAHA